jgi:hypothetical protein
MVSEHNPARQGVSKVREPSCGVRPGHLTLDVRKLGCCARREFLRVFKARRYIAEAKGLAAERQTQYIVLVPEVWLSEVRSDVYCDNVACLVQTMQLQVVRVLHISRFHVRCIRGSVTTDVSA